MAISQRSRSRLYREASKLRLATITRSYLTAGGRTCVTYTHLYLRSSYISFIPTVGWLALATRNKAQRVQQLSSSFVHILSITPKTNAPTNQNTFNEFLSIYRRRLISAVTIQTQVQNSCEIMRTDKVSKKFYSVIGVTHACEKQWDYVRLILAS